MIIVQWPGDARSAGRRRPAAGSSATSNPRRHAAQSHFSWVRDTSTWPRGRATRRGRTSAPPSEVADLSACPPRAMRAPVRVRVAAGGRAGQQPPLGRRPSDLRGAGVRQCQLRLGAMPAGQRDLWRLAHRPARVPGLRACRRGALRGPRPGSGGPAPHATGTRYRVPSRLRVHGSTVAVARALLGLGQIAPSTWGAPFLDGHRASMPCVDVEGQRRPARYLRRTRLRQVAAEPFGLRLGGSAWRAGVAPPICGREDAETRDNGDPISARGCTRRIPAGRLRSTPGPAAQRVATNRTQGTDSTYAQLVSGA